MSWMKRPQGGAGTGPGPQPFAAPQAQPFPTQQSMYPNYQGSTGSAPQQGPPPQQYWAAPPPSQAPPPPQQYNQQYAQVYQQEYPPNANQHYQQYNHNYASPQQNYYQNQPPHQAYPRDSTNNDGWEDNWDWGWEESAKQAQKAQNAAQHPPVRQEQAFNNANNANVLEDSFAPTNTWNWAMDDKKGTKEPAGHPADRTTDEPAAPPPNPLQNEITPEHNLHNANNVVPVPAEEVTTLSDRDVVKERMPNLALGRRFHLDNLTPQWSIESQMSQESSDGPQTHSESTYRSENQSRNSNSPGPNTDNSNYNYSQSGLDDGYTQNSEWSKQSDEPILADSTRAESRRENDDDLSRTMQDLTLANHENPASEIVRTSQMAEPVNSQQNTADVQPPPASLPPPVSTSHPSAPATSMPPPPPPSATSPPAAAPVRPPANLPPPPSSAAQHGQPASGASQPQASTAASLPPPSFPPPSSSQNPFKHAGPFAHKPKTPSTSAPGQGFPPQMSGANLTAPTAGGKAALPNREPVGFEANLETTPDNSERPDQPAAAAAYRPPAAPHPVPDNLEVAPRNDRNEYLQTAHLSGGDYGEPAPPPGLRRMVVGRQEGAAGDEPPPGLARMVPGRQTDGDGGYGQPGDGYRDRVIDGRRTPDAYERRPVGLDRMVPGEPSAEYAHRVVTGFERDGTMEGENLQDLGEPADARPDPEPEPERRSSGDADRDRAFQQSPRRDRRRAGSRDRYERRSTRDDRRSDRDRDRRERDESPEARRRRRAARSRRYETEDTDYYSDRDRDRRRHREGSYSSKPPRPEEAERGRRAADRHERAYRDIDPSRKHGNRRRDRDRDRDDDRRRVTFSRDAKANASSRSEGEYSGGSRSESRSAAASDEDAERRRAERRARRAARRANDTYYDQYGAALYGGGLAAQQYSYYERLRRADPAAYMQLYTRLMAGRAPAHAFPPEHLDGYSSLGYELRGDERASVHSGRSSAAGLKGNDTYPARRGSPHADLSDRDLATDVSLPTNLDTSTVRSERMTPHRFSTAHVKASLSSRHLVVVRGAWPADGRPAAVQLVSLPAALAADPVARDLAASPGPLIKGVTHKKSVMEYCGRRAAAAAREGGRDPLGYLLLWDLLALLLRQNGVVVGSDIAELLMKNTREYEYKTTNKSSHDGSRRESSVSGAEDAPPAPPDPAPDSTHGAGGGGAAPVDEAAALDKLREYLLYGNRQEALEWAMSCNLWGHALHLAAYSERRARGAVAARFLAATPRADPLHTLYAALAGLRPPAATCAAEERWGDWRPHAAIILANGGARPDHDTRTLTTLGDSLLSRGLVYSAQFCYVSGGVQFARHPLAPLAPAPAEPGAAPPRLALLLAPARAATLAQLAPSRAILATEIYEYALSLNRDYVIPDLQVYKLVLACRLIDCGLYERALAYVEQAARAVAHAPRHYSPLLIRDLAELGDRLKYHDPALHEDPPLLDEGEGEGSPRHQQWLSDVAALAHHMQAGASQHTTPQHLVNDYYAQQQQQQQLQQQQYSWDQANQYQQQQQQQQQEAQLTPPAPPYPEAEESAEPPAQYYQPAAAPPAGAPDAPPQYAYEDWSRTEEHHAQAYADAGYWRPDAAPYNESTTDGAAEENPRPMITMPGASAAHSYADYEDDRPPSIEQQPDREPETPKSSRAADGRREEAKAEGGRGKGGGWLGGILTKLSLRPPNQMILPDDKNPTIVWDAEHKRWRNLDGDAAEGERAPPPPPRTADLPPTLLQNTSTPIQAAAGAPPGAPGAPPAAPLSNIFKMQKGRHIKKSYVDVFNPGGAAPRAPPPAPGALGPAPALAPDPQYFVPAPAQSAEYEGSQGPDYHIRSGI